MLCRCDLLARICPWLFRGRTQGGSDRAEKASLLADNETLLQEDVPMQRPDEDSAGMLTEEQIRHLVDSQVRAAAGRGARGPTDARP